MVEGVSRQCEALYLRDCDLAEMRAKIGSLAAEGDISGIHFFEVKMHFLSECFVGSAFSLPLATPSVRWQPSRYQQFRSRRGLTITERATQILPNVSQEESSELVQP